MSISRSTYFEAFASIMKITLRDNNATDEEKSLLQHFGRKLGVTSSEYFELIDDNMFMRYEIEAPYMYNQRLESLYRITKIVYEDVDISKLMKEKWLYRMGIAIGFDPSNIKYVVGKSLDMFNANNGLTLEDYEDGIKNIMM
ncbi:hypothetical protein [Seonamhaeicola maritimus]|uniref:TerB family tellurite resistance protein n=1 Tax=Seonamhaeicola maritimus TaxID=2591822 RepID=A0A5C7GL57_9FLAO|nr:hypothetical protein [Seonamhaeicola maritimus]TXG39229.1 hypothetical protein FUA22_04960 [Seonamhaeicola maritimus]